MSLQTIKYAKVRGGRYHFNIPIPATIQHLYPAKAAAKFRRVLEGTTKTSDPKIAADMIADAQATMRRQARAVQHEADQARIAKTLDASDQKLLAAVGGVDGLLQAVKDHRIAAAFTVGAVDDPDAVEVEGGYDTAPTMVVDGGPIDSYDKQFARRADQQEIDARLDALTAEIRRLKAIAGEIGAEVPESPKGLNEGGAGIRELAASFCVAHNYTVQNRESVENTVRRWIELHGDMPVTKWTRAHLKKFDDALKGLPSTARSDIRGLTIAGAIKAGAKEGLEPIGYKTRKRYSDHMKAFTKYALNSEGTISADPFAGFTPAGVKVKHSKAKETDTIAYTPNQVGMILDHCEAKFDRRTWDYWLPMLAAYTGARREEIGQLTVDNVRVVGNMHVLDITDMDPAQKIKNKHSLRSIPIPSPILKAGFVEYVQARSKAGATYLFQRSYRNNKSKKTELKDIAPDKRGRFTEVYGRNFPRTVREPLGLTEPGMKFHSLRHSWTDAARRAGIDSELRRKIAGRMENEDAVEGGYGDDELLGMKLAALEVVAKEVRD